MTSNKEGKQVDIEVLVATASNDWKNDPLPPMSRDGERRILWPVTDLRDEDHTSLGPGHFW